MKFINKYHEVFYKDCLRLTRKNDSYRRALFYTLGIHEDTRKHINELYDFENECIILEALEKGWVTAGTYRACLLAFNLYNGYTDYEPAESTPYNLFCDSNASYYFEAIKIRYPEYIKEKQCDYERY